MMHSGGRTTNKHLSLSLSLGIMYVKEGTARLDGGWTRPRWGVKDAGGAAERLRLDAPARLAGHAVVETGTHVEILGEQGWWSATITWREEGSGGRLVWMRSSTTATRTPSVSSR